MRTRIAHFADEYSMCLSLCVCVCALCIFVRWAAVCGGVMDPLGLEKSIKLAVSFGSHDSISPLYQISVHRVEIIIQLSGHI